MQPYKEARLFTFTLNYRADNPAHAECIAQAICDVLNEATKGGFDRTTGIPPAVMGATAGVDNAAA